MFASRIFPTVGVGNVLTNWGRNRYFAAGSRRGGFRFGVRRFRRFRFSLWSAAFSPLSFFALFRLYSRQRSGSEQRRDGRTKKNKAANTPHSKVRPPCKRRSLDPALGLVQLLAAG